MIIQVSYSQYELSSPGSVRSEEWPDSQDGLLTGEDDWLAVICGTDSGMVNFDLRVEAVRPDAVDTSGPWEMLAERDLTCRQQVVAAWNITHPRESPRFSLPSAGRYRLRVHVSGRAEGRARRFVLENPPEHHLVLMWPAVSASAPSVLKGPDSLSARTSLGE